MTWMTSRILSCCWSENWRSARPADETATETGTGGSPVSVTFLLVNCSDVPPGWVVAQVMVRCVRFADVWDDVQDWSQMSIVWRTAFLRKFKYALHIKEWMHLESWSSELNKTDFKWPFNSVNHSSRPVMTTIWPNERHSPRESTMMWSVCSCVVSSWMTGLHRECKNHYPSFIFWNCSSAICFTTLCYFARSLGPEQGQRSGWTGSNGSGVLLWHSQVCTHPVLFANAAPEEASYRDGKGPNRQEALLFQLFPVKLEQSRHFIRIW